MATNPLFNQFTNTTEQNFLDSLYVESIQLAGHDVYYIPAETGYVDDVLVEDRSTSYISNYPVEMYVSMIEGYGGDGDLFSNFGYEIRDQFAVQISKTTFESVLSFNKPREGDLIYVPMSKDLFKITFVEDELPFYQLGKRYMYELKLEKFEYADEHFDTGIPALDAWANKRSLDIHDVLILEDGTIMTLESGAKLIIEEGLSSITLEDDTTLILEDGSTLQVQGLTIEEDIQSVDPFAQNDVFDDIVRDDGLIDFSKDNAFFVDW